MVVSGGLTAAGLLDVVDAGVALDPAGRGRVLLQAAAGPEVQGSLDAVGLGGRDAAILRLRCATFGETLTSRVTCPDCGLKLTVRVPFDVVSRQAPALSGPATCTVETDGLVIEARAPDGALLARAAACPDVGLARDLLIAGCVVSATRGGVPVAPAELDEWVIAVVGEALIEADPQVEVSVGMSCAGCGREWSPVLDIVQYLWRELETASVQILDEVHQLAVGYGWTEEQVLRLPSQRRRQYVDRVIGA